MFKHAMNIIFVLFITALHFKCIVNPLNSLQTITFLRIFYS